MKAILTILLLLSYTCHAQVHLAADAGIWQHKASIGWYAGYTYKHVSGQVAFNTLGSNVYMNLNAGYDIALTDSLHIVPFAGVGIKPYRWIAGVRANYKWVLLQWMNSQRFSIGYIYTIQ